MGELAARKQKDYSGGEVASSKGGRQGAPALRTYELGENAWPAIHHSLFSDTGRREDVPPMSDVLILSLHADAGWAANLACTQGHLHGGGGRGAL